MMVCSLSALIQQLYKWTKSFQSRIMVKSIVHRENNSQGKSDWEGRKGWGMRRERRE